MFAHSATILYSTSHCYLYGFLSVTVVSHSCVLKYFYSNQFLQITQIQQQKENLAHETLYNKPVLFSENPLKLT